MNRALMAPIGSVLVSLRRREPCLVRATAGGWSHRYREGVAVHPRWGGASARLQDQQTRDHFLYGYEPSTGDTVLDVGAGVGGEVRLFSRLVGSTGRVVCVEAHPTTYGLLSQTIALNELTNVRSLCYALTDINGTVFLSDDRQSHINNGLTDRAQGIAVPGRTLEDILRLARVHRVDLLKMNIEGAELAALEASRDALRRVRNIVVSCHDFKADAGGRDWQRTFAPVRDLLTQAGFRLTTRPDARRPPAEPGEEVALPAQPDQDVLGEMAGTGMRPVEPVAPTPAPRSDGRPADAATEDESFLSDLTGGRK